MISFYLITKSFQVKKIKYLYLLLFFMAYFAQVFGCQFILVLIYIVIGKIKRRLKKYERHFGKK